MSNTNNQKFASHIINTINKLKLTTLVNTLNNHLLKPNPDFWEAANVIGAYYNENDIEFKIKTKLIDTISLIREQQGQKAKSSQETTTIVFGTSGWRGLIGEDFTILNVHKATRGIIEMMKSTQFLQECGYKSFLEVQEAGILIFRDNRFMGDDFMDAAMKELAAENIRIYVAGECPTGVGSAVLTELKGAGSINFTPSHNPMGYAGIKFNPSDGGPADTNLTSIIEQKANNMTSFTPANNRYDKLETVINAADIFTNFLETKSKVFNLDKLRNWLKDNKENLCIAVDFMHGSSRGYIERVIGEELNEELLKSGALNFFNKNDDYSFHGVKPEPSAKNQAPLIKFCQNSCKKYTLAVALDPDADRIRFADCNMDIEMNLFGAIAFHHLTNRADLKGGIASTAPSSDFALEIAKIKERKIFETAVGFKNFRAPLKSGEIMMAFEESDGITFTGHTLEKCAIAGFLMALQIISTQKKNISTVYEEIQKQYGYFYPGKSGTEVKGVSVEEWQDYKKKVVNILQHDLFQINDKITVGKEDKKIVNINTIDGLKVIFEDKSWILLRPSGTEPKFRYYYEITSDTELENRDKIIKNYCQAAEQILLKARKIASVIPEKSGI